MTDHMTEVEELEDAKYRTEENRFTKEKVMRWLVDFGSDWVDSEEDLTGTWADTEIYWDMAVDEGYLETRMIDRGMFYDAEYRLTEKAIAMMEESDEV